jgi:flagellar biosynthesis/type III secretory pathway protein FliH
VTVRLQVPRLFPPAPARIPFGQEAQKNGKRTERKKKDIARTCFMNLLVSEEGHDATVHYVLLLFCLKRIMKCLHRANNILFFLRKHFKETSKETFKETFKEALKEPFKEAFKAAFTEAFQEAFKEAFKKAFKEAFF